MATKPTRHDDRDKPTAPPKTHRARGERSRDDSRGDTGRYSNGYRVYRDGSYREDFGSDR
jgi:hypothetical protein